MPDPLTVRAFNSPRQPATASELHPCVQVLPFVEQLEDPASSCAFKLPTDYEGEQHAMLIRDVHDWGIVVGSWKMEPRYRTGHLSISFFSFKEKKWDSGSVGTTGQYQILGQRWLNPVSMPTSSDSKPNSIEDRCNRAIHDVGGGRGGRREVPATGVATGP